MNANSHFRSEVTLLVEIISAMLAKTHSCTFLHESRMFSGTERVLDYDSG